MSKMLKRNGIIGEEKDTPFAVATASVKLDAFYIFNICLLH